MCNFPFPSHHIDINLDKGIDKGVDEDTGVHRCRCRHGMDIFGLV